MKKKLLYIILTLVIGTAAYFAETTQAQPQTVVETKTIEKEIIPAGYVDTTSESFQCNYLDMRKVTDFTTTESGLQLYLEDGTGYYWER